MKKASRVTTYLISAKAFKNTKGISRSNGIFLLIPQLLIATNGFKKGDDYMTISEIKKQSLRALTGNWGEGVLVTFLVFIIIGIPGLAVEIYLSGGFFQWLLQDETPISADLINIFLALALSPLSVASYWYFLSLARLEGPQPSDIFKIFSDGNRYFKLILTALLQGILLFLWTLLLVIPGIIKAIAYSQSFYILKDHPEFTPLEAISESNKRMKGNKGKYFILSLSFIGWGILAILTLGIGFLWLNPYISTSMANFYNEFIYFDEE